MALDLIADTEKLGNQAPVLFPTVKASVQKHPGSVCELIQVSLAGGLALGACFLWSTAVSPYSQRCYPFHSGLLIATHMSLTLEDTIHGIPCVHQGFLL